MPSPGHFILHSRAVPPLGAGDYVLEGDASIPGMESTTQFEAYRGHLRVTSPRFRLPPDQILSTFPPANAEGGFESRLPQVVLRRRTLPWERIVDAADRKVPWLALVVIAEGEGELSAERPVAECVTPGVTLTGPNDVATGIHLTVAESVVRKVFPTKEDLPLLTHVREVDIADTELAMGDDDGYLAVVLANRLPQFDRQGCKPVRYMACLINLEGQLDALPPPTQPADVFVADAFVFDAVALANRHRYDPDLAMMGHATTQPTVLRSDTRASTKATGAASSAIAGNQVAGAAKSGRMADWTVATANVASVAVSAAPENAYIAVRDAMKAGFRLPIEVLTLEKVYRFPVLAHWSFTCTGAGSFETFMQGLDVGLLGTLPSDPTAKPAPECIPPIPGDAPPPAPPSRPDPELAETGHVGLPHQTRRGDAVRAWYRGPLTPHVTERAQPEGGRLPLAHTSDQLRRIVPDGREDVSLAGAFEIGRLLALSHPSIVAALMRWRREQFGIERSRRLAGAAAADSPLFRGALEHGIGIGALGQLVGRNFVLAAAEAPGRILAPERPVADPGRPLRFLGADADLDRVLAQGFGIPLDTVRAVRETADAAFLADVSVPLPDAGESFEFDVAHLRDALAQNVERMAVDALRLGGGGQDIPTHVTTHVPTHVRGTAPDTGPDALDRLLDDAARRRAEEVDG
jgi:hypothetical protein